MVYLVCDVAEDNDSENLSDAVEEHNGPEVGSESWRFIGFGQGDHDTFAEGPNWLILFQWGIDDTSDWSGYGIFRVFE